MTHRVFIGVFWVSMRLLHTVDADMSPALPSDPIALDYGNYPHISFYGLDAGFHITNRIYCFVTLNLALSLWGQ